jgi:CheY-like chemotaxis protein
MVDQLSEVEVAASRAAELTRQLLAFSRQQVLQPTSLALDETVAALESMLRRLLPADITLVVESEPTSPIVADRGQIEQVVTNLVLNARDAMPDGGTLQLEVHDRTLSENEVADAPAGAYVEIVVRDTGHGMDAATLERIFEPFFTTKETGQGTGLGLSTVEGIIAQSGGFVAAESQIGMGTAIAVYLPVNTTSHPRESTAPPAMPVGGTEHLLVVEDDDGVRRLVGRILRDLGYDVLEAVDPADALRVAGTASEIDLVLTDLVMPGATGRELAEKLSELRPGIRVLFMSGYTDDEMVRRGLLPGASAFIQKPFRVEDLASTVREVLEAELPPRSV